MKLVRLFMVVSIPLFLVSCATAPKEKAACPRWTEMGGQAMNDGADNIYGVGLANNIGNVVLLRETADNRAIAKVAKQVDVLSTSLMKDYMSSVSSTANASGSKKSGKDTVSGATAESMSSEEQAIESAIKTVVKQSVRGVKIVDRCNDKGAGIYYSLAKMPMNSFTENFATQPNISKEMSDHVRQNADKLHEQMK